MAIMFLGFFPISSVALPTAKPSLPTIPVVDGIPVRREPLYRSNDSNNQESSSPYCLVASTPPLDRPDINFLASQVWPSARMAAQCLQTYLPDLTEITCVCELGCGPGLPSLTAAVMCAGTVSHVVATDVDAFALQLVQHAAQQQGLASIVHTQRLDLIHHHHHHPQANHLLPAADLYVLSDVFESAAVAQGAARLVSHVLQQQKPVRSRVWVFCQSDRAQRDVFVQHLQAMLPDDNNLDAITWTPVEEGPPVDAALWLCDIDETKVQYG